MGILGNLKEIFMIRTSDKFILIAVVISFVVSAFLWFSGSQIEGIFTAIWVPSILCFAIYFKILGLLEYLRGNRDILKGNRNILKEIKK
jgi:hypothetical protein